MSQGALLHTLLWPLMEVCTRPRAKGRHRPRPLGKTDGQASPGPCVRWGPGKQPGEQD